jgi:CDP-glucose 4,6-dehydratase
MVTPNPHTWNNRSVFVTGHTGFKGGWLCMWLHQLGAKVHGYALSPPTDPNLFEVACVADTLATDTRADLADLANLSQALAAAQPEVVFHLAAQPLVRESYRDPLGTLMTNVMGTAHVLEAARRVTSVKAIIVITTDKVYRNLEWDYPYRELDELGGHDPYSASKAAAEIIVASYRSSFFADRSYAARVATVRAGNVLGGGDWAADRLVPDCLRAFEAGEPVHLRAPESVRPWQHVLEPLSGYLLLAEHLLRPDGSTFASAWNFGPDEHGTATVGQVAEAVARYWSKDARVEYVPPAEALHEAGQLRLDSSRARNALSWKPRWSLQESLQRTVSWHAAWRAGEDMLNTSLNQIRDYQCPAQA